MIKPDTETSVVFLTRFWNPSGPWALTSIDPDKKHIETRSFAKGKEKDMRAFIDKYNGNRNLYFTVNPIINESNTKPKRDNIKELAWLHVDVDPEPKEDFTAERVRILKLLQSPPGLPKPTLIIDSGGGFQAFWRLADPFPIDGEEVKYEEAKRWNQQLEIVFNADNCHNVDRIMRLPGTVNLPDVKKKAKGRQIALASIAECNDQLVYELSRFTPAPKLQSPTADKGSFGGSDKVEIGGNIPRLQSVEELGENVKDKVKIIIVQGHDPDNPQRWKSRSEILMYVCCELVRAGISDEVIYSILTDPDFGISASILDKKQNSHRYAIRQIERAKEEAIEPWLRKMNEKYAVVLNYGGCKVVKEEVDPVMGRSTLVAMSFDDIRQGFMNKFVVVGKNDKGLDITMQVGKWWLGHPQRRQYETVVFAPNMEIPDTYNLWKGYSVPAIPGDCSLFLSHIKDNICRGKDAEYQHLLKYMAWTVQFPGHVGEIAIVLRGEQGVGKSLFAKEFGALFGRHFLQVSNPSHLIGNFNAHLEDCVVLFADEAFFAGDKRHESVLKTLVTEENILIERKRVDAKLRVNSVHLIMASNSDWVVPADIHDRRFYVLDVNNEKKQDSTYFGALINQLRNGGREALLHTLLTMDLTGYDVRKFPRTEALNEQKRMNLTHETEWWMGKLLDGKILKVHVGWQGWCPKDDLWDDYIAYMKDLGLNRRMSKIGFSMKLKKLVYPDGDKDINGGKRIVERKYTTDDGWTSTKKENLHVFEFPSLEHTRANFVKKHEGIAKFPEAQGELTDENDRVPF